MSRKPLIFEISIQVDKNEMLQKAFDRMKRTAIYVGIPSGADDDKRDDGEPITNSELGYIHEFGSPSANIPARPFLKPGVQSNEGTLRKRMRKAAVEAMRGNEDAFSEQMERAALGAAVAVQEYMREGEFAPLAPSTVRQRIRKIKKLGSTDMTIKPLIDTGSLRQAITGVVVEE